jgi:tRNA threonylcarbamoyladenosine biosynthesis protein TsaB
MGFTTSNAGAIGGSWPPGTSVRLRSSRPDLELPAAVDQSEALEDWLNMRIVAIETSGQPGSLAIGSGDGDVVSPVREVILPADRRTAQALAPALRDLLAEADWPARSIELVVVAVGPGSFTGLRIGVTTAKTFAYAVGADVVGVNTLDVLAVQTPPDASSLWAIMDAQRSELFAAKFAIGEGGQWAMTRTTSIISQEAWLRDLQPDDRVTGPALRRMQTRLPASVTAVPEHFWQPTAAAVAMAGWQAYQRGKRDDVWNLVPQYYRASAAEEKAKSRGPKAGGAA